MFIRSESSSVDENLAALDLEQLGVVWLPRELCLQEIESGVLVAMELDERRAVTDSAFYMVFPSHSDITRRVALFRDYLLSALAG